MKVDLHTVNPETPDKLRDAQRNADQKIVDELRDKIARLEAKIDELKAENEGLEAWIKSEKSTYRLQYPGPCGHL